MRFFVILFLLSQNMGAFAQDIDPSAQKLKTLIIRHCVSCHVGNGDEVGKYGDFVKPDVLQLRENLSPGIMLRKIESDEMPDPLYGDFLSEEQKRDFIASIKAWYDAGKPQLEKLAEVDFVDQKKLLDLVLNDLATVETPSQTRYFSFLHYKNNPGLQSEFKRAKDGFFKFINSISWAPELLIPEDVSGEGWLYRLELSEMTFLSGGELTNKRLDQIILNSLSYPYGREYERYANSYEIVKLLTKSRVPILRGDWTLFEGSQPPLYHSFLQLPRSTHSLERLLGVDIRQNIANNRVVRSGFADSGVSQHNRIIERHPTDFGAYWVSYDFINSVDQKNIFAFPLGPVEVDSLFDSRSFSHNGGEVIFNLPNGLQAYLLVDERGRRIDRAPTEIVSDPNSPDRSVINGISCMRCHDQGLIEKSDQIFPVLVEGGIDLFSGRDKRTLKSLYGSDQLDDYFRKDRGLFKRTLRKLGVTNSEEPISEVYANYEQGLNFNSMAFELGRTPEEIDKIISRPEFQKKFASEDLLFSLGKKSTIKRELFERNYLKLQRSINGGLLSDVGQVGNPSPIFKNVAQSLSKSCSTSGFCIEVKRGQIRVSDPNGYSQNMSSGLDSSHVYVDMSSKGYWVAISGREVYVGYRQQYSREIRVLSRPMTRGIVKINNKGQWVAMFVNSGILGGPNGAIIDTMEHFKGLRRFRLDISNFEFSAYGLDRFGQLHTLDEFLQ